MRLKKKWVVGILGILIMGMTKNSSLLVNASTGRQAIVDAAEFYYNTRWSPKMVCYGWYDQTCILDDEHSKDIEGIKTRKENLSEYQASNQQIEIDQHMGIWEDKDGVQHEVMYLWIDHRYDPGYQYNIPYGILWDKQGAYSLGRYIDCTISANELELLDKLLINRHVDPLVGASYAVSIFDFYQDAKKDPYIEEENDFYITDYGFKDPNNEEIYKEYNCKIAYFMDCSSFVSTCWQTPRKGCAMFAASRPTYNLEESIGNIELGDAIVYPGHHIILITDKYVSSIDGQNYIVTIEESGEAGCMVKSSYKQDNFIAKFGSCYKLIKPTADEIGNAVWNLGTNGLRINITEKRDNNTGNAHA